MFHTRHLLPAVLLMLLFLYPGSGRADTAVILPSRDNTLIEDPAGALSNGSGPSVFAGVNGQGTIRRAVLYFDLTAGLPSGSVVNSVALNLNVSSSPTSELQLFTLHRLLADWGEGVSSTSGGSGAASSPGDATWLHTFYPDQFWTAPGGDFEISTSASTAVGESGVFVWSEPGMAADVQGWLENPETNFGWLLRGDESKRTTVRRFDSRENSEESVRPTLVVDYTPGATQVQARTWGYVKSRYHSRTTR